MGKISDEELLFLSNLLHVKKEDGKGEIFGNIWTEENINKEATIGKIVAGMNQKLSALTEADYQIT